MPTDNQDLLVARRDGVLYLTLNRPDRLNALSDGIISGLLEKLSKAAADREVGAIVITGAGRGFCAGGDINRMRDRNEGAAQAAAPGLDLRIAATRRGEEVTVMLREIPKVTIAAVNGPVAGAGLGLCLACDVRIASEAARFGTAFARVGFSGDYGGSYFLTQLVGTAKARELYFSAEMFDADEALRLGLSKPHRTRCFTRRGGPCLRPRGSPPAARCLCLHERQSQRRARYRPAHSARPRGGRSGSYKPHGRPQGSGQGFP